MEITVYFNPKCGTCRNVVEAIEAKGLKPRKIEYLKTPPSVDELDSICRKAGIEPQALIRQKEALYQGKFADKHLGRREWLTVLHQNPILIERPIVVVDDRAMVVRPAERLSEIL